MLFAHDTEIVLGAAEALVNTSRNGVDTLRSPRDVSDVLSAYGISDAQACSLDEFAAVCALRRPLRDLWRSDDLNEVVAIVNTLLENAEVLPRLVKHAGWDWHVHFARPGTPLDHRVAAEIGMGMADVVRQGALDRLRECAAPDCDAVLVDLSRNRSRLYCDTSNCGNRQHVAAYRARKASGSPQVRAHAWFDCALIM